MGDLPDKSLVKIMLKGIELDVHIGLHEHEKGRSQRVVVNIELFAAMGDYLVNPSRQSIINYDHIYKAVKSWAARPHTELIETYLKELTAICFKDPRIEACRISVTKPDIFPEVETAGVEVFVQREDFNIKEAAHYFSKD